MSQTRVITRKRLDEIGELLKTHLKSEDELEGVLKGIASIFNFDPTKSTYDENRRRVTQEYRDRKKAEGITTYITSGGKVAYQKRKNATKDNDLSNNNII